MLNLNSPSECWEELAAGEKLRDASISTLGPLLEQYAGSLKSGASADPEAGRATWPVNHAYEMTSYLLPKLAHEKPRVSVRSHDQVSEQVLMELGQQLQMAVEIGAVHPMAAQMKMQEYATRNAAPIAAEHGLNRWIEKSDYKHVMRRVAFDTLFSFGCLLGTTETLPENPELRWPRSIRISPRRFCMDPLCLHASEARWMAHWSDMDRGTLILMAQQNPDMGWDLDAINKLAQYDEKGNIKLDRDTVQMYEIWVRDIQQPGFTPEMGFNGTLLTLGGRTDANTNSSVTHFIRDPQPFYGRPTGPYSLIGAYVVPDCPYPLSPLGANFNESSELNAHARAMSRNAAQYKRLVLVAEHRSNLAETIKGAPDMLVVPVQGLQRDEVISFEIGGITDQQLKQYGFFNDRLLRVSGLSDAQRGFTDPDVTATSDAIAEGSSQLRISFLQTVFADGIADNLKNILWYMDHDERIDFPLGPEVGEKMGMAEPRFKGGDPEMMLNDPVLTIDVYSMERTNQALLQRQLLEAFQLVVQTAPMMVQMPFIDWRDFIRRIGDTFNVPDLSNMIDWNMIQQAAAMQMAMGLAGGGPPQEGQPSNGQAKSKGQMSGQNAQPARQTQKMQASENRRAQMR